MGWVERDREEREARSRCWKSEAFVRTLPEDLHLKYKLRILEKEDWERIKELWEDYELSKPVSIDR